MFAPPLNSSLGCEAYFNSPGLHLPKFLVFYAISQCMEDLEGEGVGGSGGYGIDRFITSVANEYFMDSHQVMVLYDESWDITEMLIKLESQTKKSFVTYYMPLNVNNSQTDNKPPDHLTHRLLPIGLAFIVFVKNEDSFINMLEQTTKYPWWNKRARLLIMLRDKSLEHTKGILELLESEKIFNGVVVSEFLIKDNSTGFQIGNSTFVSNNNNGTQQGSVNATEGLELQIVALDPYPIPGHSKQSFVARWKGTEYTASVQPIFHEKIDNLRGNKLIACVFEFPPLVIKTEVSPGKYVYSGQEVLIFQQFAKILNFTYEFYEPPAGEKWGMALTPNNWSGLIGETQRNADFGFASIFLLDNRELVVDISNPYDEDKGCFAVPRPESLQNWLGLILPFSWQVWACILAMALVAGPIFSFITRPLSIDKSLSVGRGIFYALGSLVSAQKAPQAKSSALRTFIIFWLIFCWLSYILYRVALIVSLTSGSASYKIDSIKQLVRSGLKWGGFKEVLKTFDNTSDREDEKLFDRFTEITNVTEALDRVAEKGNFAVLDSNKFLLYAKNGRYFDGISSAIHITKECPTRYNVGFAMPIGSPFLDKINELIRRLQSAGLIDKWLRDILHEATLKNPNKEKKRTRERPLSLDNMKLCYIILFCGHFCGFASFCVENIVLFYQERKDLLLSLARKISIISSGPNPAFVITNTDSDTESLGFDNKEHDSQFQKNIRRPSTASQDKMVRLYPPLDPERIDEEEY